MKDIDVHRNRKINLFLNNIKYKKQEVIWIRKVIKTWYIFINRKSQSFIKKSDKINNLLIILIKGLEHLQNQYQVDKVKRT